MLSSLKTALRSGLVILLALGLNQCALGQHTLADSSLLAAASRRLNQQYTSVLGSESRLYNGPEYSSSIRPNTQGHPFFAFDEAQPATVVYAGYSYANMPLRYDLLQDRLVLAAPGSGRGLTLVSEQVARFTLGGHAFVRLVVDSSASSPVRTSFYELLVEGPVRLLAAHQKTFQKRAGAEGVESEIIAHDEYFIYKDHRYYPVSKETDVLRLFPQHKAALRQYTKNNKLNFRPASREQALAGLVRYQATLAGAGP